MSNDCCSPYNCNVCLMLRSHQQENKNHLAPDKEFQYLLTCSGCQLVKYCNRQHQKLDWPIHREFCQAVQKIKQNLNLNHPFHLAGVPRTSEEIEKSIVQFKYLLRNALGRKLEYQEEELSSFPPFCGHCFKFKNLKSVCTNCYSQVYCTNQHREMHKEKHGKVCELLQIYYCPYKVRPTKEEFHLQFSSRVNDLQKLDLVEYIQNVFCLKLPLKPCEVQKNYQLFSWAADFSCVTTICYAISVVNLQHLDLAKFSIFILGASVEAVLWFRETHCKIFFLQNPHITELTLDFIGPEVVKPTYKELKISFLGLTRLVKFNIYKGLFQDYCKYFKVRPSIIMVFNCGFSEFSQYYNYSPSITNMNTLESLDAACYNDNVKDTWFQGLIEILQTFDTPIVFTSFTEQESQFDLAALQNAAVKQCLKVHISRIFKVEKNPFHDLRPLRQWYVRDQEQFYYRNGYIQAIRTKLEKFS